jgi:hypothetical protein
MMTGKPRLNASDQAFADQWAHLWDDAGDVDPTTAKPCIDIHSRHPGPSDPNEAAALRAEAVEHALDDDHTEGDETP